VADCTKGVACDTKIRYRALSLVYYTEDYVVSVLCPSLVSEDDTAFWKLDLLSFFIPEGGNKYGFSSVTFYSEC
jgi:hypothetical protein